MDGGIEVEQTRRQAFAAFAAQNFAEAERLCRAILAQDAEHFDAHHLMGGLRAHVGDWQGAMSHFDKAIALCPNDADAQQNRARAIGGLLDRADTLSKERFFDDALKLYDLVVASEPRMASAWNNRANTLYGMQRYDEAMVAYDRAIELDDKLVIAHSNRGNILARYGRFTEAMVECDKVLALAPKEAAAHHNKANALRALRRYDEALASYRRALTLDPNLAEARVNNAMLLLQLGRFAEGAAEFEWRWKLAAYPKLRDFAAPRWAGTEPIAGKRLLVHGEQGQGDVIQFCRFAKMLTDLGAKVVLEAPAGCVRLFASLKPTPEIVAFGEPLPDVDFQIPIMSLMNALNIRLETLPSTRRYLEPPPDVSRLWRGKMPPTDKKRIGIAWSGNPAHHNDYLRSMPRTLMEGLADPGLELVSLQKEERDDLTDFADTAALIDCLDLVITVDTSVAHLAGALGAKIWILIPYAPDWRWFNERSDSPWYPSMKLYRQSAPRDWDGVIERVKRDLNRIVADDVR